jgi:pimeloyl-ACP methyl ester carboxylesterase
MSFKYKPILLAIAILILLGISVALISKESKTWALEDYYSQDLNWRECYDGFECSSFKVPVDYEKISKNTFTLKVLRHSASDERNRLGAIFVNPGGPGGSATDYAYNVESIVSSEISSKFDIIGFDPRGINTSEPIRCLSNSEEDEFLSADASSGEPKKIRKLIAISKAFAAKCEKAAGAKLGHYSTLDAAKDMEVLRNLLKEKNLNYLGKSYGTYLGTLYAALYPQSVGRMVLDGAVAPNISLREQEIAQAVGFDKALDNYLSSQNKFKMRDITKLLANSSSTPMENEDGRLATESLVITAIAQSLYDSKSGWPGLTKALELAIEKRDPIGILELADRYYGRDPSGNYYSNQNNISIMITCLDWQENRTVNQMASEQAIFKSKSSVFGPYLSFAGLPCKYWKAKPKLLKFDLSKINTKPILVIGVTEDPATPYKWAQVLSKSFRNAELLTLKGEGHTGHNRGNKCVDSVVDTYFLTGKIPSKSLICA